MAVEREEHHVKVTFVTPLLGAVPKDKEIYTRWVAGQAPDITLVQSEIEDVPDMDEEEIARLEQKGWTGFLTDKAGPYLGQHVPRGFFKAACGILRRVPGSLSSAVTAYKKVIDGAVFVEPWKLHLEVPSGGELDVLERAMRGDTAQGARNFLQRSDRLPVGTGFKFTVWWYKGIKVNKKDRFSIDLLKEWLDHGEWVGFGQWRGSGGRGRFTYELD